MKNDTSPSARQPYSYADALHSLLIIPPSDRQPPSRPSRRGAHPDGRSAVSSHQHSCGRPGRCSFHQPHGPASAVTSRLHTACTAPLSCAGRRDRETSWHGSQPCSGAQQDKPPNSAPSLAVRVTQLNPSLSSASHIPVKHIFPKIIQSKL